MTDLPEYFTGITPMYGLKQPSQEVAQGNDIVVEFTLSYNKQPLVDVTGWKLEVFFKKSLKAAGVIWRGELDNGLYQVKKDTNQFFFRIPHEFTAQLMPGNYFFAIRGTQKIGTDNFDKIVTLYEGMVSLDLDASSPLPKLANMAVAGVYWDPVSGKYTVTIVGGEATEPTAGTLL